MAACAGATGIPLAVLRQAKRAGCPAFDQASRVHLGSLLVWLFADENAGTGIDWHGRWKRAQALGMEQRVAKERGELFDLAFLLGKIHEAAGACRGLVFQLLETEPMKFAAADGDVAVCREVLQAILWDQFWPKFGEIFIRPMEELQANTDAAMKAIRDPKIVTKSTDAKKTEVHH